ncbi:ComEC/Rec2 family competence protein [Mumia zhuanghuii]|uniref:ComEC/Rec2 family competence protein n=1 Tax=Mumia zhuanghuii TaxID=2585211 RepID=UPI003626820D
MVTAPARLGERGGDVDLRMVAPALAAWAGAVVAVRVSVTAVLVVSVCAALVAAVVVRWFPSARRRAAWVGLLLVLLIASLALGALRASTHRSGVVPDLAAERASVAIVAVVASDPKEVRGTFGTSTVLRLTVLRVEARGATWRLRSPVTAWVRGDAPALRLGQQVDAAGRLDAADDSATAATLSLTRVSVRPDGDPAWWWDGAQRLRDAITAAVSGRGTDVSALVPALVHGDDHALSDGLREDFRTSGLTHLLAVSGTNLTLLIGFLLALARPLGAGPRARVVLAVVATVGYVLLARPEPSVVRAAVMGLVGIAGLSTGGRRRGARCLAWAVVAVVLLDPWLATSAGFLLSAVATGGILLLAPVWRDALARWMPLWFAEAIAVPAAAQLACTAPVAALSGEVSLVAVVANLVVAPAVGPATVLGLAGGLAGLLWAPLGTLVGLLTTVPAGWIVLVGRRAADLPGASAAVGEGPITIALLVIVSGVVAVTGHLLLRRPLPTVVAAMLIAVVTVAPLSPGWPPRGWVMVACDVGQGDATVLRAGPSAAVVIDAGPDPGDVGRCLDDLGIRTVPLVVLTHAHADHVDGLSGVIRGRDVGWVGVGLSRPSLSGGDVRRLRGGERWRVGDLTLTVLAPLAAEQRADVTEDEANDASVVLVAETQGARILLTGDVEPPGQAVLRRTYPDLRVDVLKVPHHGSAHQDAAWLADLGARWATVSAGRDNTYGHPAPATLTTLNAADVTVLRTDAGGDVAVVVRNGEINGVRR